MKKKLWCTAWILTGLMIGGCSAEQGGEPDSEIAQESQRETMETSENKASEMINTEESDKAVLEIPTLEIPTIGIVSEKKTGIQMMAKHCSCRLLRIKLRLKMMAMMR